MDSWVKNTPTHNTYTTMLYTFYQPRIFVCCVEAYKSGDTHGIWIDASQSLNTIQLEIESLIATSPAPNAKDWVIRDFRDFGDLIDENTDLETIADLGQGIAEYGSGFIEFAQFIHEPASLKLFEEWCHGYYDSTEDFVKQEYSDIYWESDSDFDEDTFDWYSLARQVFESDYWYVKHDEGIYVFSSHGY